MAAGVPTQALHSLQTSPRYQPQRSSPHCNTFSSFRGDDASKGSRGDSNHAAPASAANASAAKGAPNEQMTRNNNYLGQKSTDAVIAIKPYASNMEKFARAHPYYRNEHRQVNNMQPNSHLTQITERSGDLTMCDTHKIPHEITTASCHGNNPDRLPPCSSADHSNASTLNRGSSQVTDDDAATTTSGSYVVDPQDLCDDLEQHTFCQGMVV